MVRELSCRHTVYQHSGTSTIASSHFGTTHCPWHRAHRGSSGPPGVPLAHGPLEHSDAAHPRQLLLHLSSLCALSGCCAVSVQQAAGSRLLVPEKEDAPGACWMCCRPMKQRYQKVPQLWSNPDFDKVLSCRFGIKKYHKCYLRELFFSSISFRKTFFRKYSVCDWRFFFSDLWIEVLKIERGFFSFLVLQVKLTLKFTD